MMNLSPISFKSNAVASDKANGKLNPNGYVFIGHHPTTDSDSVLSALCEADFAQKMGATAHPLAAGPINPETRYVLNYFGIKPPEHVDDFAKKHDMSKMKVVLVDHNLESQIAPQVKAVKDNIAEIIDHHHFDGLKTNGTIFVKSKPVGSTATIVKGMFEKHDVPITPKVAGLLLSAIISDTRKFVSETTKNEDIKAAQDLAEIADINIDEFAPEMLKAGDESQRMTADQLVNSDIKHIKDNTVAVGQIQVIPPMDNILGREQELLGSLEKLKGKGVKHPMLMITEGIEPQPGQKPSTYLLYTDASRDLVHRAFNDVEGKRDHSPNIVYLPGVMSRKLGIMPRINKVC